MAETVTPEHIIFRQQVGQNSYTINTIKKGRGYVTEVKFHYQLGPNRLAVFDSNEKSIKVKYIERLRVGDRIAFSSLRPVTTTSATSKEKQDMHGMVGKVPFPTLIAAQPPTTEQNFLATVVALGEDGRSLILDRTNDLGYPITYQTLYRQSFYRGSTGKKRIYLGAHWGSNLDDYLVDFPDKHVTIRSLVNPEELPYRCDFTCAHLMPTEPRGSI